MVHLDEQEDVIFQLEELLTDCKKLKPNDCIIIMVDLNCELYHNVQNCTGKCLMNKHPDNGNNDSVLFEYH